MRYRKISKIDELPYFQILMIVLHGLDIRSMSYLEVFCLTKSKAKKDSSKHIAFNHNAGGVVQLVRTSACHAEGREFESRRSRHKLRRCDQRLFFFFR